MAPPRVTLLTDFGTRDGFVGAVKGVIASLAPDATVDDISHDIPLGDVSAATAALARYWLRYPEGTVHLVVVDPGVGTERRALACAVAGRLLVGPDNGVLTPALDLAGARCVSLDPALSTGPISATFHARDLFAPAAAALVAGRPLAALGALVTDPVRRPRVVATRDGANGVGVVIGVDGFGNASTNLPGEWATKGGAVDAAGRRLALFRCYGDVAPGEALALVDSEGWIELAVRDGSAADRLGLGPGTPVRLIPS